VLTLFEMARGCVVVGVVCGVARVFFPKYRGEDLVGWVEMVAEGIIRKTCSELGIEVIDMFVSSDHIHIFIQYPPKYSISFIAKRIKGRSSKVFGKDFPHLNECAGIISGLQVAITALWVMAGMWLRNISLPTIPMNIIGNNS